MRRRSRAHEAGSVEAGSSISKSIFLLIVSLGRSLGHSLAPKSSQPGDQERTGHPNRANQSAQVRARQPNRSNQGTQERKGQANRASQGAQERTGHPNRATQGAQECAGQPNRGSQGTQERAEHPNRSNQGDIDETLPLCSEIDVLLGPKCCPPNLWEDQLLSFGLRWDPVTYAGYLFLFSPKKMAHSVTKLKYLFPPNLWEDTHYPQLSQSE